MMEAVEFVHAEGWDASPTLFALVPTSLLIDQIDTLDEDEKAPLTLVVQDNLPQSILPGSEELAEYVSRIAWPEEVAGVVLAQEIKFKDASTPGEGPRPARLFSGALRDEEVDLTLLQIRPTVEEIEAAGPFAEDQISLRGGPDVAPGIISALRYGLEQDPEDMV
ncbi:PPA1309 family protein [Corynebacterium sp. S7]